MLLCHTGKYAACLPHGLDNTQRRAHPPAKQNAKQLSWHTTTLLDTRSSAMIGVDHTMGSLFSPLGPRGLP